MKFLVLKKETLLYFLTAVIMLAAISAWFMLKAGDTAVFNQESSEGNVREIHMVTVEFKTKLKDGKEVEVYRWDPGSIVLKTGEKAKLYISGINGDEHPFYIEGTDIKGTVKKGKETIVPLEFDKPGTYHLICQMHSDRETNGPMIADIVVN
ncbi:cupredoxin domain-containing protein [Neobacillus muris]|uniref:cupredoxin domain-containing protein n=1 Tax=Neobacillus muris TaxID=2941334 RepID=UPI0020414E3A|nr:cupredoxin domain-containing protein [Neobacillus muris]